MIIEEGNRREKSNIGQRNLRILNLIFILCMNKKIWCLKGNGQLDQFFIFSKIQ
jgi:hypothetical protein